MWGGNMNKVTISIILIISLIGCVSAVYGQSAAYTQPTAATGYAATAPAVAQETTSQYSQFYTMPTGPAPSAHIIAPQKYVEGRIPTNVYLGNQMQSVQYSQYLSNHTYMGSNSLWIQGSTSWSQYAVVPQSAFLSLIATSSAGGNGFLYEIYPDGKLSSKSYNFLPGANQIGFYADAIGQHTLLISINGQASNAIVINVVGNQPRAYQQPSYPQPGYQQPSYQPTYATPVYYRPVYHTYEPVISFTIGHWGNCDNASPRCR
jgi:hypothetical protein